MASKICKLGLSSMLILLAFSSLSLAQTPVFDRLKATFDEGMVFVADFKHTYIDSYLEETLNSDGQIIIGSDSYKLISEDQILVVDGETSTVYDAIKNRVIISFYDEEEDDFAPSRTLNGVDSTYAIKEASEKANITRIVMQSDDDFAVFPLIEIFVNQDSKPYQVLAFDAAENQIITLFENGEFVQASSVSFTVDYPEDAEIIDMRIE